MNAIRELFLGLLKSWTRTTSFLGKDVIETVRRPGALFSLIFGPFIIMGLFGIGYSGQYAAAQKYFEQYKDSFTEPVMSFCVMSTKASSASRNGVNHSPK